jgi:hypothetical protein
METYTESTVTTPPPERPLSPRGEQELEEMMQHIFADRETLAEGLEKIYGTRKPALALSSAKCKGKGQFVCEIDQSCQWETKEGRCKKRRESGSAAAVLDRIRQRNKEIEKRTRRRSSTRHKASRK